VLEVVINGRYGWLPFEPTVAQSIEPPTDLRDLVWASRPTWSSSTTAIPSR
jgi:type VI secretion system protein ImpE